MLDVQVGFDPTFSPGPSNLPPRLYNALVDTGALESCIDSDLAKALHLPVVDRMQIAGAQGASETNVHLGQIHVPALEITIFGRFAAVDLSAGGQPYLALIGRSFLQQFSMIYDGRSGVVIISNDHPALDGTLPSEATP